MPPVVSLQSEWFYRRRQIPDELLQDFGGYAQALWRFAERWSVAARYEYGSPAYGDGGDVVEDPLDPEWTSVRRRYAASFTFYPTEFSRLRLQAKPRCSRFQRRLLGTFPRRGSGDWRARCASVLRATCDISYDSGFSPCCSSRASCSRLALTPSSASSPRRPIWPRSLEPSRLGASPSRRLALPSQDPHFVDARPHLALELSKADLLILVGADLELGCVARWSRARATARSRAVPRGTWTRRDARRFAGGCRPARSIAIRATFIRKGPHYLLDRAPRREGRGGHRQELAELDRRDTALTSPRRRRS